MPAAERGDCCRIPPLAAEAAARVLEPPHLPEAAARQAAAACQAAPLGIPVCLVAPAPAHRLLIARALHALAGRGTLVAGAGREPPLARICRDGTLYVDAGALAPSSALALEALLDDGAPWVIAGVEPGAVLASPLRARLATVVVTVPPLATRTAELGALANAMLRAVAARRGASAPALSAAAVARLRAHSWPGDLTELEAVLARALVAAGTAAVVDVPHLAIGPAAAFAGADPLVAAAPAVAGPAASAPAPAPPQRPPGPTGADAAALELLLAELAHEIKNPLVTVKTFADHLPELLADAALRERFAALAGDAIGRIDDALENLLAFARLGAPAPRAVSVGRLLDRVVAEVEPSLAERQVAVRRAAGDARCAADPEHVAYALRNLLAGVVREVPARGEVSVDASVNGVVRVGFATANGAAARLRRLAMPEGPPDLTDPTLLPLPFTLARAALTRAGGSLAVEPEASGRTAVVVRLPVAAQTETGR